MRKAFWAILEKITICSWLVHLHSISVPLKDAKKNNCIRNKQFIGRIL